MRWMLSDAKACSICCTGFPMVLGRGIICRMARVQGVKDLISVSQSHIDGCTYVGPASLQFAEKLRSWDAEVRVPTTLNAISVDRLNWRMLGVPADSGEPAEALANAYLAMGAAPSFTCAPYLLENAPRLGEQIGWGESNAVVFANSILGARSLALQEEPRTLNCSALSGTMSEEPRSTRTFWMPVSRLPAEHLGLAVMLTGTGSRRSSWQSRSWIQALESGSRVADLQNRVTR